MFAEVVEKDVEIARLKQLVKNKIDQGHIDSGELYEDSLFGEENEVTARLRSENRDRYVINAEMRVAIAGSNYMDAKPRLAGRGKKIALLEMNDTNYMNAGQILEEKRQSLVSLRQETKRQDIEDRNYEITRLKQLLEKTKN